KPQCLKRWQKSKSPQVATPTHCLSYSWSWRRKTR
ncbi:AAA domain family protein, partial [Vibrio parahaemolyticus IDH02640]